MHDTLVGDVKSKSPAYEFAVAIAVLIRAGAVNVRLCAATPRDFHGHDTGALVELKLANAA
jgi:hypothetical protein